MSMGPRPTQNGYNLNEVRSALQKEIRRGKEYEAMMWALEMIPRYERYLWRSLLVVVHEDIGLANPGLLRIVPECRRMYFEMRAWDKTGLLPLANAILMMARSAKSRLSDHFVCVCIDDFQNGKRLKIPDYALDKHTTQGKRLGRGLEHWMNDGTVLVPPPKDDQTIYQKEAEERWRRGVPKFRMNSETIDRENWDEAGNQSLFPKFLIIDDENLGDEINAPRKKKAK